MKKKNLPLDRIHFLQFHYSKRFGCEVPVARIDEKGFAYCESHGLIRKNYMRCRKLRSHELRKLESGKPLARYAP